MPKLALFLWLVYGVVAGARVLIHRRRTGASGFVAGQGPPGTLPRLAEMAHPLAIALGLSAPVLALAGVAQPIEPLDSPAAHVGAAVFALAGLAGLAASQAAMGRSWRVGTDVRERTELITHGPFAFVRHPIYTSLVALFGGLALLAPNLPALASVVLFTAAVQVEARLVEEPHLLRSHGEAYRGYAARTGRFLPRVGRGARGD